MPKKLDLVVNLLFFAAIFALTLTRPWDTDVWLHLAAGKLFVNQGIVFKDIFSFTAQGQSWIPFEWLFQSGIYLLSSAFGYFSVKIITAATITLLCFILKIIFEKIFELKTHTSLPFIFAFYFLIFDYILSRPLFGAIVLLAATYFLIFLLVLKDKNLLFLLIPIVLIWQNLHTSVLIVPILLIITLIYSLIVFKDKKGQSSKIKLILAYFVICIVLTFTPPLGFGQYKISYQFFNYRNLNTQFVDEWKPLLASKPQFYLYSAILAGSIGLFLFTLRIKDDQQKRWLVPALTAPFLISPYLAIRNVPFGYFSIVLLSGLALSRIKLNRPNLWKITIPILLLAIGVFSIGKFPPRTSYTSKLENAVSFIKANQLNGNMLNQFEYGGFLMYNLYPQNKVFIDTRGDVYFDAVFPDYFELSRKKSLGDEDYLKVVNDLLEKYQITYIVIAMEPNNIWVRISRILYDRPNWKLIWWDDNAQIFLKDDSKNQSLFEKYQTTQVTPFADTPYKQNQEEKALEEYIKMVSIQDSAKSRNAIGFINFKSGDLKEAKVNFEKTTAINPRFDRAYINLAETYAAQSETDKAIKTYQTALEKFPQNELLYLQLSTLYLKSNNRSMAQELLQMGIRKISDPAKKQRLAERLKNI